MLTNYVDNCLFQLRIILGYLLHFHFLQVTLGGGAGSDEYIFSISDVSELYLRLIMACYVPFIILLLLLVYS